MTLSLVTSTNSIYIRVPISQTLGFSKILIIQTKIITPDYPYASSAGLNTMWRYNPHLYKTDPPPPPPQKGQHIVDSNSC